MTHNNPKIQGKFYPLQHEEWLRACRELNSTELVVLYYLKTINPSYEKITISYSVIASDLRKNKNTVSQAIQALKEKKWLPQQLKFQPAEQSIIMTFEEAC